MARIPESSSPAGGGEEPLSEIGEETSGHVGPEIVKTIGDALQAHYRALIDEPLPARILVMLAELEAKEGGDGT